MKDINIKKLIVSTLPQALKDEYNRQYDKKLEVEFEVLFDSGTTSPRGIITEVTLQIIDKVGKEIRKEMYDGVRDKLKEFIK